MLKQLSLILLTIFGLQFILTAARADTVAGSDNSAQYESRQNLVHEMNNMVLCILTDQKKAPEDRKAALEQGFANVVDTAWIAKFVLGNAWRQASDDQRERFSELYRKYLAKIYISNYAEDSERKITDIKILGINDAADKRFTAHTEVMLSNDSNMKVDYLVSEKEDGGYKIIDVTIEGVSLLATHRSEFSTLAANEGVDKVIARLEQLVHAPKVGITLSMN